MCIKLDDEHSYSYLYVIDRSIFGDADLKIKTYEPNFG